MHTWQKLFFVCSAVSCGTNRHYMIEDVRPENSATRNKFWILALLKTATDVKRKRKPTEKWIESDDRSGWWSHVPNCSRARTTRKCEAVSWRLKSPPTSEWWYMMLLYMTIPWWSMMIYDDPWWSMISDDLRWSLFITFECKRSSGFSAAPANPYAYLCTPGLRTDCPPSLPQVHWHASWSYHIFVFCNRFHVWIRPAFAYVVLLDTQKKFRATPKPWKRKITCFYFLCNGFNLGFCSAKEL